MNNRNNRDRALAAVVRLLEAQGHDDLLVELRAALQILDAYETDEKTISEVTRVMLGSEKTYRLVFSHELDPMSIFDPATGRFLEVNDSWVSLYGYTREEAMTMKVTDVSAEPARTAEAIERLPLGATMRVAVRWHRAKDGAVFPVELTAGKVTLGGRVATYAVMRDITQRHSAERALARSEASHRALIEGMPDGVIVHRLGRLVYLNPAARRMLGYSQDEDIVGKPGIDIVHPDDQAKVTERVLAVLTTGLSAPLAEIRLMRRDGTNVVAEIAGLHGAFDGEPSVIAIARDVTARREIEAQLVMNDRLASLGRLSASVGHELNNPLACVLGNIGLLEREVARMTELPSDVAERFATYVKVLGEGARRMRDIVHDLKTLARGDGEAPTMVDVQHLLDVCTNMAEHELRPRASVVKDYRDRAFVFGTQTRLGQVFLNLLVNAAQAISEDAASEHEVRIVIRAADGQVIVEISDTGAGVPREHRERIFEPFFTTKDGGGTGLGLSISHRIVTSAGGTITYEPREGGGTVFRVTLPSADGPSAT